MAFVSMRWGWGNTGPLLALALLPLFCLLAA